MSDEYEPPLGQRFSQIYLRETKSLADSLRARRRLYRSFREEFDENLFQMAYGIERLQGVDFSWSISPDFETFFIKAEIKDVLDAVTTVRRIAKELDAKDKYYRYSDRLSQIAKKWQSEVNAIFVEENLMYEVDADGVVRMRVDEEFSRTSSALLEGLQLPKLRAVRAEVEKALANLTSLDQDTKGAVRAIFEAAEILVRLVDQRIPRLNSNALKQKILPIIEAKQTDPVAKKSLASIGASMVEWVNSVHTYRHGHDVEEPAPPPLSLALLLVSQGMSFIRFLLDELHDKFG